MGATEDQAWPSPFQVQQVRLFLPLGTGTVHQNAMLTCFHLVSARVQQCTWASSLPCLPAHRGAPLTVPHPTAHL